MAIWVMNWLLQNCTALQLSLKYPKLPILKLWECFWILFQKFNFLAESVWLLWDKIWDYQKEKKPTNVMLLVTWVWWFNNFEHALLEIWNAWQQKQFNTNFKTIFLFMLTHLIDIQVQGFLSLTFEEKAKINYRPLE